MKSLSSTLSLSRWRFNVETEDDRLEEEEEEDDDDDGGTRMIITLASESGERCR